MVISGPKGCGQSYIGSAILHHLEGYHVQILDLANLISDSTIVRGIPCVDHNWKRLSDWYEFPFHRALMLGVCRSSPRRKDTSLQCYISPLCTTGMFLSWKESKPQSQAYWTNSRARIQSYFWGSSIVLLQRFQVQFVHGLGLRRPTESLWSRRQSSNAVCFLQIPLRAFAGRPQNFQMEYPARSVC